MRTSIAQKGLILVAAPLLFELVFAATLTNSLRDTEAKIDSTLKANAMLEQSTILMRELVATSFSICFHYLSDMPGVDITESRAAVMDTYKTLAAESASNPSLKENSEKLKAALEKFFDSLGEFSKMSVSELISDFTTSGAALSEIRQDMRLIDRNVRKFRNSVKSQTNFAEMEDIADSSRSLKELLLSGVLISLAISLMLALNFTRTIASKLRMLAENTRRVAGAKSPLAPLGGNDEIAMLDLVIHELSEKLRASEYQRQKLSAMVQERLSEPLSKARKIFENFGVHNEDLSEKGKATISKAIQILERLVGLLEDLTHIEQFESGRIKLEIVSLQSQDLLSSSLENVHRLAAKKSISIKVTGEDLEFQADRNRITQIIVNLLSNAIKFSPPGAEIELSCFKKGQIIEFRVKDQGPGVPEQMQAKIFERYEQTSRDDATSKGGAGLGLAICALIARSHGGKLGLDSETGKGSEFWLQLPDKASPQPLDLNESKNKSDAKKQGAGAGAGAGVGVGAGVEVEVGEVVGEVEQFNEQVYEQKKELAKSTNKQRGFRIWQKGLLVVAFPLLLQIAFVATMYGMLEKAQKQTVQELKAMYISELGNELFRNGVNLGASAGAGYMTAGAGSVDQRVHENEITNVLNQFIRLYEFETKDSKFRQQVSSTLASCERLLLSTSSFMLDPPPGRSVGTALHVRKRISSIQRSLNVFAEKISLMLKKQQAIERKSPALRKKSREEITALICLALLLSVALSVVLGFFFSKGIAKRIKVLAENTIRFSQGKELSEQISGSDELCDFDRDFRHMIKQLEESSEFKKHLLAVVSHELRTPLANVFGTLDLLGEGLYGKLKPESLAEVQAANLEIEQVIQLVNDLLEIERMDAGKYPLALTKAELRDLLAGAIGICKTQGASSIEFKIQDKLSSERLLEVDIELLEKALARLILHCSKEGKESKLRIIMAETGSTQVLKIEDAAETFASDSQINIAEIEKFKLLELAEAKSKKGKVLTLALVKAVLSLVSASLSYEKVEGENPFFVMSFLSSQTPT